MSNHYTDGRHWNDVAQAWDLNDDAEFCTVHGWHDAGTCPGCEPAPETAP
jgi:hypothetical protein